MKLPRLHLHVSAFVSTVTAAFFGIFLAFGVPAAAQIATDLGTGLRTGPAGVIPGRYIVLFRNDVNDAPGLARAMARGHGVAVRHAYGNALKGFSASMSQAVANRMAADPNVRRVEPDLYAWAVTDIPLEEGVQRIGADLNEFADIDDLDDVRIDVNIAILDTGIDYDNVDLNVLGGVNCVGGGGCDGTGDKPGDDDHYHGTHVAGIAAALDNHLITSTEPIARQAVGVAPGAGLWAVKVLDQYGNGSMADIAAGLDWVAANTDTIDVANMSLSGIGYSETLREAVQAVVNAGVVVVVAAGNNGRDVFGHDDQFNSGPVREKRSCVRYGTNCKSDQIPAAYPEVATISAMADSDGLPGGLGGLVDGDDDDTLAGFSNYANYDHNAAEQFVVSDGGAIDMAAPGVQIFSTIPLEYCGGPPP